MADKPVELWVVQDNKRLWSRPLEGWDGKEGTSDNEHLIKIIDEQMEMIRELHKHLMEQNKALFYMVDKSNL